MLFKLIVLSPFELPYSSNRGKYNVGDLIQFDTKNKEHIQHLLRLLEDVQYSRFIQPLQKLPDDLVKEFNKSIKSQTVEDTSTFEKPNSDLLKEDQKEKLNKILRPLEGPNESKIKEDNSEIKSKVAERKKARYDELDKLHWAKLKKLAEEQYNLEYKKFEKDIVINDILSIDFPDK